MIAALIRWSARNVFLVGLVTIFVTLVGIYAVSKAPLDAIPDLSVRSPGRRKVVAEPVTEVV